MMDAGKYKTALAKDPKDRAALRALGEIAASESKWQELVNMLHQEAALLPAGIEKADLLFRAGRVRQRRLNDLKGALEDFKAAWAASAQFTPAREAQREIFIATSDWEALAASLADEASQIAESNAKRAAALDLLRAQLYRFKLNDPQRAREACEKARSRDPNLRASVVPLFEMDIEQQKWEDLEAVLSVLAASSSDSVEKTGWEFLRSHVLESRLGKPAEAASILDELLAIPREGETYTPPFVPLAHLTRAELIEAGAVKGDHVPDLQRVAEVTGAEEDASGTEWRATIYYRLGECAETAGDDEGALWHFNKAHELDPPDPRPLRAMARLQRSTNRHKELSQTYTALLYASSGKTLSSLWHLLCGLTLHIGLDQRLEALDEYKNAGEASSSLRTMEMEAGALRHLGRWQQLAALLGQESGIVEDPKLKTAILTEQAETYQYGLKDPAKAVELLRQALSLSPTALGLLRSLAACYAETSDLPNQIRVIIGQERLVSEQGYLIHLGLSAGDIWRRLGREDEAFKSYSGVVRRDPNHPEALLALEDICYRQKSYKNLYGIQRRFLETLGQENDTFRRAILLDNASLLLRNLNNPSAASQHFMEASSIGNPAPAPLMELRWRAYAEGKWSDYADIANREAQISARPPALLWRAALTGWAREDKKDDAAALLDEVASRRTPDAPLLATLMALHCHRGDWFEWLRRVGEIVPLVSEQARSLLFWQMGGAHRWRVDSPQTAAECYARMAELDPGDILAYESMKFIYLEGGLYEQLRNTCESLLAFESDVAVKVSGTFYRADLAEVLESPSDAVSDLRKILELDPNNIAALRRLERLYSALNNPIAQIEVLRHEVSLRKDPKTLVLLHLRVGSLWETQGRATESIAAYKQVLSVHSGNLDALDALRRLHLKEGHWKELVEVLGMYAKSAPETNKKIELYHERAKICEEKLSDIPGAISSLEAALVVNPKHFESLTTLERLYEITEAWDKVLNVLGRQIEHLRDAEALHRVHFKMGSIFEEKMNAPSAAIESFVKAHDLLPQHLRTLDALERLYDQAGEAAKLVPILEKKAALLPEERIRLYMWIGRLWAEQLADPQKAIASYVRVVALDQKHLDALNALENLYEQTGEWDNLIRTIESKGLAVEDRNESVELLCKAGGLWIEKFSNDENALAAYIKALEFNPRHRPALEIVRQIYARAGQWENVVLYYAREIEFTTDPKTKALLLASCAKVVEEQIGDMGRAASQYEVALRSNPNCQEAIRPLAKIYFKIEKWEQAEPLYRKWVAAITGADDSAAVAEVFYQQGRVYQGLRRDKEALDCYAKSIELKPDYVDPLKARSELHSQRQEWKNALEAEKGLLQVYEELKDNAGIGESLRRAGGYQEHLGLDDDAIKSYNRSLEVAGENAHALERLADLYFRKGLFNNVAGILDRLILVHQGTPEEPKVRFRKGQLLEEKINDKQGALKSYEAALAADPMFNEAYYRRAVVLIDLSQWDDAEAGTKKLLEIEKNEERIADSHCLLGNIAWRGRKDLSGARAEYEKALKIIPGHSMAIDSIGAIIEAQGDWQGYIKTFEQFLKTLPPTARDKILHIHMRLAQVWRDKLGNKDKAIIEFSNVVKIDPDNAEAHGSMAALYIQNKSMYPQAIRENNILLKTDPFRVQSYHDLSKMFEEQREVDRAFCSLGILEFLGALEKWDRTNYEARLPHLPLHSQKSVDDDLRDRALVHPSARHPATTILEALGSALCRVFATGRPSGERAAEGHPISKLAEEIAANLGLEEYEIYLDNALSLGVSWFPASPPAVIISPRIFESLSERGRRFLVGRGLEGAANGLFAAWGLSETEVRKRLQVAVKLFRSDTAVNGVPEKDAIGLTKQLKKEIPRKVRKGLDEVAEAHHNQERAWPFDAWLKGMEHSANRGGLLVSAHPGETARTLLLIEGLLEGASVPDRTVMGKSEQVRELLRFAVSDQYFTARKKTGFSLY